MATGSRSGSLSSLREFNRLRIVDFLRTNGTASRAELARRTGLSRSTVSTLVADLQRRGLVVERAGQFAGEGQPGRPAALLELDPSAAAAVGVDFDHDKVRVAVSDLSRSVLAEASAPHDVDHDAQGALDLAAELVERVLDETDLQRDRLLGVGIALAGPIDHDNGALHPSDVLPGWVGRRRGGRARGPPRDAGLRRQRRQPGRAGRGDARRRVATPASPPTSRSRRASARASSSRVAPTAGTAARPGRSGTSSSTRRARSAAAATAAASRRWPPDRRC